MNPLEDNSVYATFLIPQHRLDGLEKLIGKLARKIEKGKTTAEVPVIEATREVIMINGRKPFNPEIHDVESDNLYPYVWVTLKYEQPKLNGWQLVAVYDWEITEDGHKTCYMSVVPGQMVPESYREVEHGECEHCNMRRRRKQSMLVTKSHVEFKVVGSTCIKDFLGHHNPKTLMELFSFENTIGGWSREYNPGETHKLAVDSVAKVLAVTAMFCRTDGYIKSRDYEKLPTAHAVSSYLHDGNKYWHDYRVNNKPTENDIKKAEAALKWGKEQAEENGDEEYWDNMGRALTAGAITPKRFGLVCSLMYAYFIAEKRRVDALRLNAKSNQYLGTVGERIRDIEATVVRARPSYGFYGDQTIITLETPSGDTIVWFASGSLNVEEGEYWKLTGTVKKHSEYRGTLQTQLTRVVYEDIDAKKSEAA